MVVICDVYEEFNPALLLHQRDLLIHQLIVWSSYNDFYLLETTLTFKIVATSFVTSPFLLNTLTYSSERVKLAQMFCFFLLSTLFSGVSILVLVSPPQVTSRSCISRALCAVQQSNRFFCFVLFKCLISILIWVVKRHNLSSSYLCISQSQYGKRCHFLPP